MSKIIIQTIVTNLAEPRTLSPIGKRGIYLGTNESATVEGAYPSSCRNPAQAAALCHEVESGRTNLELITNLPVHHPDKLEEQLEAKSSEEVKEEPKKEERTGVAPAKPNVVKGSGAGIVEPQAGTASNETLDKAAASGKAIAPGTIEGSTPAATALSPEHNDSKENTEKKESPTPVFDSAPVTDATEAKEGDKKGAEKPAQPAKANPSAATPVKETPKAAPKKTTAKAPAKSAPKAAAKAPAKAPAKASEKAAPKAPARARGGAAQPKK